MDIKTLKILNSIIFFTSKEKDKTISRLKLMKLLWLSDRIHLNKYGRLILKDCYNALPHGPVPSLALNYSKNDLPDFYLVHGNKIQALKDFDSKYFSESDLEVMNFVWSTFGNKGASGLRNYSHDFPEWLRFKKELEDSSMPNSYEIVLDDFFENPNKKEFYDILKGVDISNTRSHFHSHNAIHSILNK